MALPSHRTRLTLRTLRVLVALVVATSLVAACSSSKSSKKDSGGSSVTTIRLGIGSLKNTLSNEIFFYGMDKGIFKAHGVNLQISYLSSAAAASALASGSVDMSYSSDALLLAVAKGGGKVFMTTGLDPFGLYGKTAVPVADLKGKTIASSTPGSSFTSAIKGLVQANGLDPNKDIKIVYLQNVAGQYAALKAGSVQFASLSPPTTAQAEQDGFVKVADLGPYMTPPVMAVSDSYFKAHADVLKNFVSAMKEATQGVRANPTDATQVYLTDNPGGTLTAPLVQEGINAFLKDWSVTTFPNASAQKVLAENPDTKSIPLSKFMDTSIVDAVGPLPPPSGS